GVISEIITLHGDNGFFKTIKTLIIGGEVVENALIHKLRRLNADLLLINAYGPTETCANSITGELLRDASTAQIGTPIPNTQIYIVDEGYNLSLPGTIGEVCISGAGLARGYLNQELLTAEKFVPNPFLTGERMYRTGDLGRWMPDGNVEYLGR